MKDVTAIILGGGRGDRLMPLTIGRCKPAVGFAGKYRLIDIPISNCINSGIERQYVLTQFLTASLHRHVAQTYHFDNFSGGFVEILAAEQTLQSNNWFQGTADAVRATFHHINYYSPELMLILSGDQIYRMDYRKLIDFHRESDADVTVAVQAVPKDGAAGLGLLRVDEKWEVQDFAEKPSDPEIIESFTIPSGSFPFSTRDSADGGCLASMGIYLFRPSVLEEILSNASLTDFGKEVIPAAVAPHRVMAYPFDGYWRDVGTIESYYTANIQLTHEEPDFTLGAPEWPLYTHRRSLPPSRIIRSEINDSVIAEGSEVTGAWISKSVLGTRSVVGKGSHLDGVLMLGADFFENETRAKETSRIQSPEAPALGVGEQCHLERVILDKNVRIGDRVRISAFPDVRDYRSDLYWIRDGITVIPSNTVIPSDTVISPD